MTTPTLSPRKFASPRIDEALGQFERRFNIQFTRFVLFSETHLRTRRGGENHVSVRVASSHQPSIIRQIEAIGVVANTEHPTPAARRQYLESLKSIYLSLDETPEGFVEEPETVVIAPEREGRILAESLGWLPVDPERALHPDVKRIPYEGGLLVGLNDLDVTRSFSRGVIVDGAIASGATVMAIMQTLLKSVRKFRIYSVHATYEGLRAVMSFAQTQNLEVEIFVGHATKGLNHKYYATIGEGDHSALVVGDLGDTISGLGD